MMNLKYKIFRHFSSMKKLGGIMLLVSLFSCAGSRVYQIPGLEQELSSHRIVAVLPFTVQFSEQMKRSRRGNTDFWEKQQMIAGVDQQKSLFIHLSSHLEKGKMKPVVLQDFTRTNAILKQNNIFPNQLAVLDKSAIAQLLEVDAVFYGITSVNVDYGGFGSNNGTRTILQLFQNSNKSMLWEDSNSNMPNSPADTPEQLANRNLQALSKTQPYFLK